MPEAVPEVALSGRARVAEPWPDDERVQLFDERLRIAGIASAPW